MTTNVHTQSTPNDHPSEATCCRRLLTTPEVAEMLGVSEKTVRQWRHLRTGPLPIRLGHLVRYRPADIEIWLAAKAEQGRAWMAD